MANPKGAPGNLKPVRTKEEAKKRGAAGGKKSGESRRAKRDIRQALEMVLNMGTAGAIDDRLAAEGYKKTDRTNMTAVAVGLVKKAQAGDVAAARTVMDFLGFVTEDQRLAREERQARTEAIKAETARKSEDFAPGVDGVEEEDVEDVHIYVPEKEDDEE